MNRIEEVGAAIQSELAALAEDSAKLAALRAESSTIRAAIEQGAAADDPMLSARLSGLGDGMRVIDGRMKLRQMQITKLRDQLGRLQTEQTNIQDYLGRIETALRNGAHDNQIRKARVALDMAEVQKRNALENLQKGYDDLAALAGEQAANAVAGEWGRDLPVSLQ